LILSVIKPLIRSLMTPAPMPQGYVPAPAQQAIEQRGAQGSAQPRGYEQQVADARTLVNQDPARVAQVVKSWVADHE
jgi:flagellar M-ring protein FliF